MKILPVISELLHADGWTSRQIQGEIDIDRQDADNSLFSKFCERAYEHNSGSRNVSIPRNEVVGVC